MDLLSKEDIAVRCSKQPMLMFFFGSDYWDSCHLWVFLLFDKVNVLSEITGWVTFIKQKRMKRSVCVCVCVDTVCVFVCVCMCMRTRCVCVCV